MKYMLLMQRPQSGYEEMRSMAPDELKAHGEYMQALDDELRAKADDQLKALLDGVELTERELMNVLEKHGVKRIEPLNQKFDPNLLQAMYEIEDARVPAGSVVQVVQSGYLIGERVLRPALVAVSKGGAKAAPAAAVPPANDNPGGPQ